MCSRDNEPLLGLIWLKFEWSLVHKDKHKLPLLSSAQFHTWAHSYFMKVTQWALHVPSWWKVLSWVSEETKRDPEDESEAVFSETAGWLEGREGIKKKKRLWMNESLRGEKQRRVGKVCVCVNKAAIHTHTHVRTGCACSHHFCFPHTRLNCLLPFSLHCRHLQVLCLYPSLETSSSSCIVVHRHCCTGDMWLHYQVHSDSGPHTTSPAHQRKQTIFQNKQFPLSINLYSIINV